MPCAVAVPNSPLFLSSPMISPMFCKPTVSSPSSKFRIHNNQLISGCSMDCCKTEGCSMISSKPSSLLSPTQSLFKRKRPLRIGIPIAGLNFVETPAAVADLDNLNDVVEVDEEEKGYSVYCKRGKRGPMEDRYSAVIGLEGDSKQAFFGVFDGHGGAKAAEFSAKHMDKNIMREVMKRCDEEVEDAVKEGYLTTDSEFLKEDVGGGTCCVTALIRNGNLVVSNAGDCRAVMSRAGVAETLTVDHKPSRIDERERIEGLGGYVDCRHGVWRIQGCLAVTRGIGDRQYKQCLIAEPETKTLSIRPECEFLILASDGIWDMVSNQEAIDVVRPFCVGVEKSDPFTACKKLAALSVTRGSVDDISVMVIQLPHFLP